MQMEIIDQKQLSNFSILQRELSKHLERKMLVIVGTCDSIFDGRIKSTLPKGERILIIKKDGSILLHNATGTRPVQWQKSRAGKIVFTVSKIEDELEVLTMESYRPKTDESFFITFSTISSVISVSMEEAPPIEAKIIGDEKDFVDQLVKQPDLIEHGLEIIEREKEISYGYIDIFARDNQNNQVVIEVKKQSATLHDAHQLQRYASFFHNSKQQIRGILVASHIPEKVNIYLQEHHLESCTIPWQDLFPTIQRPSNIIRSKTLDNFLSEIK
jgi:RecB family endonuclease NucS